MAYSHKVSDHALSAISICPESSKCESLLAIGDVQGNINILKIGESLLRIDEQERKDFDEALRREKEREAQISKNKRRKTKTKNQKADDGDIEYDTEKLEMEF